MSAAKQNFWELCKFNIPDVITKELTTYTVKVVKDNMILDELMHDGRRQHVNSFFTELFSYEFNNWNFSNGIIVLPILNDAIIICLLSEHDKALNYKTLNHINNYKSSKELFTQQVAKQLQVGNSEIIQKRFSVGIRLEHLKNYVSSRIEIAGKVNELKDRVTKSAQDVESIYLDILKFTKAMNKAIQECASKHSLSLSSNSDTNRRELSTNGKKKDVVRINISSVPGMSKEQLIQTVADKFHIEVNNITHTNEAIEIRRDQFEIYLAEKLKEERKEEITISPTKTNPLLGNLKDEIYSLRNRIRIQKEATQNLRKMVKLENNKPSKSLHQVSSDALRPSSASSKTSDNLRLN